MAELRLTIGLPASGKTTYARTLVARNNYVMAPEEWVRVNWDDLRKSRGMHLRPFNRKDEDQMQKDSFVLAENLLVQGQNVIVDNTNLSENTRKKWEAVAQRTHSKYTEVTMDTCLRDCIERDAKRQERVGRAVIERMALFAGLIKFPEGERYVIVDLDGTVADCANRRKFISEGRHDWENFEAHTLEDEPIQPIINLVFMLQARGYKILIVSGRHVDKTGIDTVTWLAKYGIQYKHIFMRQGGDNRPDHVIKQEILDRLPKDRIAYVIDDRNQVVEMWRKNGLTCLQVADGNF